MSNLHATSLGHFLDLYEKSIRTELQKWGSGGNAFCIGAMPISTWALDKVREYCERRAAAGVPKRQQVVDATAKAVLLSKSTAMERNVMDEKYPCHSPPPPH